MLKDDHLLDASFAADSAAPAEARRTVRGLDVPDHRRDDVVLLTSEIVSNAVKHPGDPDGLVGLRATRHEDVLRIEVANGREPRRIARPAEPPAWDLRPADALPPSGWGLQLVDRLAARWGTVHEIDRTVVWFEVDLDADG